MKIPVIPIVIFFCSPGFYSTFAAKAAEPVSFKTSDNLLQKLYDSAVEKAKWNIARFGEYKVLVEGAGYDNVWLETQPMGGYMYGKRDPEIARNNIEIFIDYQRSDGRFPGMISFQKDSLIAHYGWFQGLFFANPAFETWFLLKKDKEFIDKVYLSLQQFDDYLWKARDSNGNGCLELWCLGDTGEDESIRMGKIPQFWPFDYPPAWNIIEAIPKNKRDQAIGRILHDSIQEYLLPVESMDIMSYSYTCRDVLARISKETGNGQEKYWREKAESVRIALKKHLWDSRDHACYDRDNSNNKIDVLIHNNLRCMYFGSFDQQMADDFIRYHLMNRKAFWTPFPLPSIAANDAMFRNEAGNNWSGQPEGLTYQRSLSALENYGHYAELTLLGKEFLNNLATYNRFTQQYDPFTGVPNNSPDGYGPSILSTLEFVTRMFGIHFSENRIYWSCLDLPDDFQYSQQYLDSDYHMETRGDHIDCYVNGQKILSFSKGIRVITNLKGQLLEIVGIETENKRAIVKYNNKSFPVNVSPNTLFTFDGEIKMSKRVPFCQPFLAGVR
jgi:hypothetical protein